MKSALSLTLIVSLAASALPVAAQEVAAGPIARSIADEGARFAAAQQNQSADAEWKRVRNLAPGTELVLTVKGSQPERRYFIQADEYDLSVGKVAGLGSPVEKIARNDVAEIRTAKSTRNVFACAAAGYFGGGVGGGLAGGLVGAELSHQDENLGPVFWGMFVGGVSGAVLVYRACRHKPEKVL